MISKRFSLQRKKAKLCYICEQKMLKEYFEEYLPTDASVNERQQETHALSCKKNESHLVNLPRGQ